MGVVDLVYVFVVIFVGLVMPVVTVIFADGITVCTMVIFAFSLASVAVNGIVVIVVGILVVLEVNVDMVVVVAVWVVFAVGETTGVSFVVKDVD